MANVLLGVTGSIAAYKSIELVHLLTKNNHQVKVVLTKSALDFVTKTSFMALGADVYTDAKYNNESGTNKEDVMQHINLAKWPDLIVIAPLTANTLSQIANGFGDNLLTATILASTAPIYLVPAMNMYMWQNSIIQENINKLKAHNYKFWGPAVGIQACGDNGDGRMLEAAEISILITHALLSLQSQNNILFRKKVVITAGSTIEPIDPVRYISNHSSGKMGIALAYAFHSYGAEVHLIAGDLSIQLPNCLTKIINVTTTDEMYLASHDACKDADMFIAVAAVTDYKIATYSEQKIKKSSDKQHILNLIKTTDIVGSIKREYPHLFVVGFAAETENIVEYAKSKLKTKNLNMIIANDVSGNKAFAQDKNEVTIIDQEQNIVTIPVLNKSVLAHEILRIISTQSIQPRC